ncbi:MAG: hypothetical protein PHN57_00960 [Candidatus Omnitrophica bacterium]|nr:hypothetical protein [Candidatus Omnitrophota bacterium]
MAQIEKENCLSLEIESGEELKNSLLELSKKEPACRFLALNLYGGRVLVRQFELPKLNAQDIMNALRLESVELLHIPQEEVVLDYQILSTEQNKIKGVFIAAPKGLILEYISCCDRVGFSPVKITASIITVLEAFFQKKGVNKETFCLLNFYASGRLHLIVFEKNDCMLLREINYENPQEVEHEVINSLRYCCARSVFKEFNEIYVSGDLSESGFLVERVQKEFEVNVQHVDSSSALPVITEQSNKFKMNLLKNYVVSLPARNRILQAGYLIAAVCFLASIILGSLFISQNKNIKELRSSFTTADYNYAKQLLSTKSSIKNVK